MTPPDITLIPMQPVHAQYDRLQNVTALFKCQRNPVLKQDILQAAHRHQLRYWRTVNIEHASQRTTQHQQHVTIIIIIVVVAADIGIVFVLTFIYLIAGSRGCSMRP